MLSDVAAYDKTIRTLRVSNQGVIVYLYREDKELIMRCSIAIATFLLLGTEWASGDSPPNIAFQEGQWFDGERFVKTRFYSVDGVLTRQKPDRIDRKMDLEDLFIVPPFGEAHNHNVEPGTADTMVPRYLREGIFYIKNPNSIAEELPKLAEE